MAARPRDDGGPVACLAVERCGPVVDPEEYRVFSWSEWVGREPDESEPCIRSARLRLAVPEVITLSHYDRLPNPAVTFSRRNVAKRDHHHVCQYCGAQPGAESITIDHVFPRLARRDVDLDQLRGRLRALQRPERGPDSLTSGHAAPPPAECRCQNGSRSTPPIRSQHRKLARFLTHEPVLGHG